MWETEARARRDSEEAEEEGGLPAMGRYVLSTEERKDPSTMGPVRPINYAVSSVPGHIFGSTNKCTPLLKSKKWGPRPRGDACSDRRKDPVTIPKSH